MPTASPPPDHPAHQNHRRSAFEWLRQTLRTGGPGQCIFAINNACNAGCDFCNFALDRLPRDDWRFASLDGAREAIDVLERHFIAYLILTGGEPLLHPDLDAIIGHARGRGMAVLLVTNGSRLSEKRCRELVAAGVTSVLISIDAAEASAHEQNRRLPRVCEKIREANRVLLDLGVQVTASVTVSRLLTDYDALAVLLRRLGFPGVTFSYPLTDLPSSFLGFADSRLVDLQPDEVVAHLDEIKSLKKRFPVVNPTASLEEMQRFVRGEPQRFECLGGYRYFYLDWNLMVWRCHRWEEPIGHIRDLDESRYVRDGCTRCMIDCFRDSSVMQHIGISLSDGLHELRRGHPLHAIRRVARKSNLSSLGAVLENRRWIKAL